MTAPLTHDCLSQSSAIPDGVHCPARKEENISKYKVYLNQEGIHKLCVNESKNILMSGVFLVDLCTYCPEQHSRQVGKQLVVLVVLNE